MSKIRINRFLADCGLGSRRKVERLVADGRVSVNGSVTADLSRLIDVGSDEVRLDGRLLRRETRLFYLMLNKPKGYITTAEDLQNRAIVLDLIPGHLREKGVMPV
ncbi:MAG TPA: S4 domain-containing protein, partial [Spirochaetota bacterium]|nr:S4 domain-containing protein [Spirochaetota bacterium]